MSELLNFDLKWKDLFHRNGLDVAFPQHSGCSGIGATDTRVAESWTLFSAAFPRQFHQWLVRFLGIVHRCLCSEFQTSAFASVYENEFLNLRAKCERKRVNRLSESNFCVIENINLIIACRRKDWFTWARPVIYKQLFVHSEFQDWRLPVWIACAENPRGKSGCWQRLWHFWGGQFWVAFDTIPRFVVIGQ